MQIGDAPGAGAFVEFSRKINQIARENVEINSQRLGEAVERGRELQAVADLTQTTNRRLDRNTSDIQATIERARVVAGRTLGSTIDIQA